MTISELKDYLAGIERKYGDIEVIMRWEEAEFSEFREEPVEEENIFVRQPEAGEPQVLLCHR